MTTIRRRQAEHQKEKQNHKEKYDERVMSQGYIKVAVSFDVIYMVCCNRWHLTKPDCDSVKGSKVDDCEACTESDGRYGGMLCTISLRHFSRFLRGKCVFCKVKFGNFDYTFLRICKSKHKRHYIVELFSFITSPKAGVR